MAETVTEQMETILSEFSEKVQDVTNQAIQKAARKTARILKNTSPKETGDYASGWAVKRETGHGMIQPGIVYNRKMPGLTHLLENGHVVRNAKGTYGRAPAHKHIAPAEEEGANEYVQNVERGLK